MLLRGNRYPLDLARAEIREPSQRAAEVSKGFVLSRKRDFDTRQQIALRLSRICASDRLE